MLTAAFQNHVVLKLLKKKKKTRDVQRQQLSARLRKVDYRKRCWKCWKIPHTECASHGETQRQNTLVPHAPLGEAQLLHSSSHALRSFGTNKRRIRRFCQEVCHETELQGKSITKKAQIEAKGEKLRKDTYRVRDLNPEKK